MQSIHNQKEFLEIMTNTVKPIMVAFTAKWCGPCIRSEPILLTYQTQMTDSLDFYKVDIDEGEEVAIACNVETLPTYILYKNKLELQRFTGIIDASFEEKIQEKIEVVTIDIPTSSLGEVANNSY